MAQKRPDPESEQTKIVWVCMRDGNNLCEWRRFPEYWTESNLDQKKWVQQQQKQALRRRNTAVRRLNRERKGLAPATSQGAAAAAATAAAAPPPANSSSPERPPAAPLRGPRSSTAEELHPKSTPGEAKSSSPTPASGAPAPDDLTLDDVEFAATPAEREKSNAPTNVTQSSLEAVLSSSPGGVSKKRPSDAVSDTSTRASSSRARGRSGSGGGAGVDSELSNWSFHSSNSRSSVERPEKEHSRSSSVSAKFDMSSAAKLYMDSMFEEEDDWTTGGSNLKRQKVLAAAK